LFESSALDILMDIFLGSFGQGGILSRCITRESLWNSEVISNYTYISQCRHDCNSKYGWLSGPDFTYVAFLTAIGVFLSFPILRPNC
jgi:hypothetical protein